MHPLSSGVPAASYTALSIRRWLPRPSWSAACAGKPPICLSGRTGRPSGAADRVSEHWPIVELDGFIQALADDGLIRGNDIGAELNGLGIVGLTGWGRQLVESKLAGHEPPGGSPASIGGITISGSGNQTIFNIQQNSPGATQHTMQYGEITAFDKRKILEWVDDVEQRASSHGLRPEDLADVLHEVAELRAEVEKDKPDVSRLQRLGRSALRILGSGAGSLASSGLVAAGQEIFSQLGS